MSWQINENYDILKENKTGNIMPDEELIVFWNERIKIISESIARFDKKYHEYILPPLYNSVNLNRTLNPYIFTTFLLIWPYISEKLE